DETQLSDAEEGWLGTKEPLLVGKAVLLNEWLRACRSRSSICLNFVIIRSHRTEVESVSFISTFIVVRAYLSSLKTSHSGMVKDAASKPFHLGCSRSWKKEKPPNNISPP